jgi:hypothetical protein
MSTIIKDTLKANRPHLSDKSLQAYTSTLKSLYSKVYPNDLQIDINKFLDDKQDFLEYLQNIEYNKRKSILSALVVVCGDAQCDEYRNLMNKDAKEYEENELKQEKTPSQEKNWVTQEQIKKSLNSIKQKQINYLN